LGVRAGTAVVGVAGVRAGLQRGELGLVVLASDHGQRTGEKVVRLARGRGVTVMLGPAAVELGRRLGRGGVQAVGVKDPSLVAGMLRQA
jgi:ribosomal protein L7Ae-like RNA K-turn-binding protein